VRAALSGILGLQPPANGGKISPIRRTVQTDIIKGAPMAITLDSTLSRNNDILYASVHTDEAVMLNIAAAKYYGLNSVGARVWELLEHPMTLTQLCAQICEEFEVDMQTCQAEVQKFANEIVDNGIVYASAA
jgi:hypothetical protein